MDISFLTDAKAGNNIKSLIKSADEITIAVAWASDFEITKLLNSHRNKINKLIIGTHFYQTKPSVLEMFKNDPKVHYMPPNGKLFHPKIYLFQTRDTVTAIVGSHNMTNAAFNSNFEASLQIVGNQSASEIKNIFEFILDPWGKSKEVDDVFLYSYQRQYQIKQEQLKSLEKFIPVTPPIKSSLHTSHPNEHSLDWSWREYLSEIKSKAKANDLEGRLKLLRKVQTLFVEHESLAKMDEQTRLNLAGILRYDLDTESKPIDYFYFGSLSRTSLSDMMRNRPEKVSKALDSIPLYGEVTYEQYQQFSIKFSNAFSNENSEGRIASASRLLCLKRPDVFVSVNAASRDNLLPPFGVARTTTSLDNYWNRIIEPLFLSPWYISKRPNNPKEQEIFNFRAALLDVICYNTSGN